MLSENGFFRLMAWTSPAFPIGSYVYSHGLEFAVEDGTVNSAAALRGWIETVLTRGGGRADAIHFCAAWRAVDAGDQEGFLEVARHAQAMRASSEMALESGAQGAAFLEAVAASWPVDGLDGWRGLLDGAEPPIKPAQSIAVALAAALADIPLREALFAYLQALAANLVSAGVRLVPLGQTQGQKVIAGLFECLEETVDEALAAEAAEWGNAAPLVDLMSMKHETQYTRLFRS